MKLATVILAAGKGTRMKSSRAKVLHAVAGRPMIDYPVRLSRALGAERIVCVLGHQAEEVERSLRERLGADDLEIVLQREQRGTGHAVAQAAPSLASHDGAVLVLYGDTPALTEATMRRLVDASRGRALALVAVRLADPRGYGRLVRAADGRLLRVVEDRDCTDEERRIGEANAGIYCCRADFLFPALGRLRDDNAQGELYLTDVVAQAASTAEGVATIEAEAEEVMGVNDRLDLARADRTLRRRVCERLMRDGVTVHDPDSCSIDDTVEIGPDSEIGPLAHLRGQTRIGRDARVEVGCVLTDMTLADGAHVKPYCVMADSRVGEGAQVGPFAHLRPGTVLGDHVKIGNFVETKKAHLGEGSKASHLTYLGDAEIGRDVNIGCGTITCNYDGYRKSLTVIEDGVFIGSDVQLVAPVTVGKGALVAAGTTVTKDVPPDALALSRVPQTSIEGWAERRREREHERKDKPGK